MPPEEDDERSRARDREDKSWKQRYEDHQARLESATAAMNDVEDEDKSPPASSSGKKEKIDTRKEAVSVNFPA